MARRFAEITFTAGVKSVQTRYGSRDQNERFEYAADAGNVIGPAEAAFIEERDGFYQATTNENDWPYVQFRGGPAGFLKVLDDRTIGYADFRGNVQYLSVGNLKSNDRVALILMDYANRRRLKIWARARIVHSEEDPDLLARLEVPTYRARVERAVVLTIEALDWNCPQHITPRFTESEINEMAAPLRDHIAGLEAKLAELSGGGPESAQVIGNGPLELVITGVRQLTPEVRAFELRSPDFTDLPIVAAGSHIEVPLPSGEETRTYSIASNPSRRDVYEIAIRLDPEGTGGSRAIHAGYILGQRIRASHPRNGFALHEDPRPAVLIADGIGITPLKAMAQQLIADGRSFHLHYAARSTSLFAYRSKLTCALKAAVTFYAGDEDQRIDIDAVLSTAPEEAVFYVCGPASLINDVRRTADRLKFDAKRIRFELFSIATPESGDQAFQVHLARSGTDVTVAHDQTFLDALLDAGVDVDYGCKSGTCGNCAVKLLEGTAQHRDSAFSDAEKEQAGLVCPCVSRAAGDSLVIDL